ncbi:hypothetical protein SK128_011242 [Halocaridina rubra]|uniref:Uncharacterized protein n=1 Tax=Halocaridina rubra TaxID=373956 RepID=A0AAN9A3J3_HALRR
MSERNNEGYPENEFSSAMNSNVKHRKKPKKKNMKKLLREAKHSGRGNPDITHEQLNYCYRVSQDLKQVEGEERELLADNFLKEVIAGDNVMKLACNRYVSRVLEDVLQYVGASGVISLGQILGKDLRSVCLDSFASHILQRIMALSLQLVQKTVNQKNGEAIDVADTDRELITEEERRELTSLLNKIGRFVYNNLDEFICDTYGSHIFRTVLEICSGVRIDDSIKSSRKGNSSCAVPVDASQILSIPLALQELLGEIAIRLQKIPELSDIITNESGSAAFQSAVFVLNGCGKEEGASLSKHILDNGFPAVKTHNTEASKFPSVFHSNAAVRLLEVIIACSKSELLTRIYVDYFKGHILELVQDQYGNFAIQKLLLSWKEKDIFEELVSEVCKALPCAFSVKHFGVIHALAEACRKLASNQGQCWKAVMKLLECYEPQDRQVAAAACLLWLLQFDDYQEKQSSGELPSVSLHGSLILQQFLQYNKTIKIVQSLMSMNKAHLQLMACDPRGSHVIDSFAASTFIKPKNKENFIQKYKGIFVNLACSKHGSRSLEAMWSVSSVNLKTEICNELVNEELKVKGNQFGAIIYSKFQRRF